MTRASASRRQKTVVTGLVLVATLATSFVQCAHPTEIVLDVRSDLCADKDKKIRTGIAIGSRSDIADRAFSATRDGCESDESIGTLTVYPNGSKDAEVTVEVITGIDRDPQQCAASGFADCVTHTRSVRFVPGQTVTIVAQMPRACLNRTCPIGYTCTGEAKCVPQDALPDGGITPDASLIDVPFNPCLFCAGSCHDGVCDVNCAGGRCGKEVCGPGLVCNVSCRGSDECRDLVCSGDVCNIQCMGRDTCRDITCNAATCNVVCSGDRACNNVTINASTSGTVTCQNDNEACGGTVSCGGGLCTLVCQKDTCPSGARCTAVSCQPPGLW